MLKTIFTSLASKYCSDTVITESCWNEINKKYAGNKRHYHNLTHLQHLYNKLLEVKENIKDWDTVLFSLFYHDIVYNTLRSDNEEESAALAEKRLQELSVPSQIIKNCVAQIIATKKHLPSTDDDTNYFTDADLSILGAPWEQYEKYFQQVRKEYAIYPDIIYNPGRKKVLEHFISMHSIFKTAFFIAKYETQAKNNLGREAQLLSK